MSKVFAVIGSPISHSKSPLIHQAAYRVLGEDWKYEKFEVAKGGLKRFIENDDLIHAGFSVTMPLKSNAFQFANHTDQVSQQTKATNTLVHKDGEWFGFNTDVFGITQAVSEAKLGPVRKSLVIGSGATATSAIAALAQLAPGSAVWVFARNKQTRKALIEFGRSLGLVVARSRFLGRSIVAADLTISTLPGQALDEFAKKAMKKLTPSGLLLDVAYSPWPSKMALLWSSQNQTVISGLEMLIWQAVAQIRIFKFGHPNQPLPNEAAVVESMRVAVSQ